MLAYPEHNLISNFLAHKPVNFALLTDSFILSLSNYWNFDLENYANTGNIKQLSGPEKLLPPWIISMPPLSRNGPLGSWTNTYRNNHNLCLCDTAPRSLFITFSTFLFTTTTSTLLLNRYIITPIWGTRKPLWAFTRFPYYLLFFSY